MGAQYIIHTSSYYLLTTTLSRELINEIVEQQVQTYSGPPNYPLRNSHRNYGMAFLLIKHVLVHKIYFFSILVISIYVSVNILTD